MVKLSVLNVMKNHSKKMNEEIKFRAYVDNQTMYPVGIFDFNQEEVFLWTGNGHIRKKLRALPIMQYIYKKDDNGKDIYEEDIVEFRMKDGENIARGIGIVKRDGSSWKIKPLKYENYTIFKPKEEIPFEYVTNIKVIGNSYENPEYLKQEEKKDALFDDDDEDLDSLIWHMYISLL